MDNNQENRQVSRHKSSTVFLLTVGCMFFAFMAVISVMITTYFYGENKALRFALKESGNLVDDFEDLDQGVACTLDAMMCPDGTAVGRIPPNCEFQACPEVNVETGANQEKTDPGFFNGEFPWIPEKAN